MCGGCEVCEVCVGGVRCVRGGVSSGYQSNPSYCLLKRRLG